MFRPGSAVCLLREPVPALGLVRELVPVQELVPVREPALAMVRGSALVWHRQTR